MLLVPRSMILLTAPVRLAKWKRSDSLCRWANECSAKARVASWPTRSNTTFLMLSKKVPPKRAAA